MRDRILSLIVMVLAFAVLAAFWWQTRTPPLLGEDQLHLADVRQWDSPAEAFARDRLPARPLQWLMLWVNDALGLQEIGAERVPAFFWQWLAIVVLWHWLRHEGNGAGATAVAVGLVLAAPLQPNLVWLVAGSVPLRSALTIAAMWAWWRHLAAPRARTGCTANACLALALLAHEGAITLALAMLGMAVLVGERAGFARRMRDPWVWLVLAQAVWRIVDIQLMRPAQQHGLQSLGAIQANAARAILGYVPHALREPWLDALRSAGGGRSRSSWRWPASACSQCSWRAGGGAAAASNGSVWRSRPWSRCQRCSVPA